MTTVRDVFNELNALAPVETKLDFDNVGLLVGDMDAPVSRVLLALDAGNEVIDEAVQKNAQLILAHHPLFFSVKRIVQQEPLGARILKLAKHGISEISMHTNLDAALGGVNDALAEAIGLKDITHISTPVVGGSMESIPRIGFVPGKPALSKWMNGLKECLNLPGIRYVDGGKAVAKVGVIGGSGGDELEMLVSAGCDTVVTADVKYHVFQLAADLGVNLIDAGHFETETVVLAPLMKHLMATFPKVAFSIAESNKGPIRFC